MTTRSLSEDELQSMEGQARKLTILDLKKQALAAKQGGNLEFAMDCLKRSKKLALEDSESGLEEDEEPPYSSMLPLFWKKVALLCKQAGDIDRAKQALLHSKELEASEFETETEPEQSEPPNSSDTAPAIGIVSEPATANSCNDPPEIEVVEKAAAENDIPPPPSYDAIESFSQPPLPPPPPTYDNLLQSCRSEGTGNEEEATVHTELVRGGERETAEKKCSNAPDDVAPSSPVPSEDRANDDDASITSMNSVGNIADDIDENDAIDTDDVPAMTFTDQELMDEEMMVEFAAGGVQGIPTQEEYGAKVLTYKKQALKFKKEGNIPKATQNLRTAKQLEKVALALKQVGAGMQTPSEDPQSWLETLNPEESELLGELLTPSQEDFDSNNTSAASRTNDRLTIEDLDDMKDDNDVIELVEMMGPNSLPTVEEVTVKITEEKQKALKYKQEGNIEMAKTSLLKSKKAKIQAMRLAEIYRMLEVRKRKADGKTDETFENNTSMPVSMEALEALVNGGGNQKSKEAASVQKPSPPKDPWLLKPSSEIKDEVIRLKNEKQVQEATRLLQLFKQKLAQEKEHAEREIVTKMKNSIQKRLEVCATQRRLWQYYHWFGKEIVVAANQHEAWTAFENDCRKAIRLLETDGSNSVKIGPMVEGSATATSDSTNSKEENPASANKLYLLKDDVTSLVESCTNDTTFAALSTENDAATTKSSTPNFLQENTLEVAILGLYHMEQNEKLQKLLAKKPRGDITLSGEESPDIRIHAKLMLPIQPEDPSKPLLFDLEPSELLPLTEQHLSPEATKGASAMNIRYGFDPSSDSGRKQIPLPRKDPKHERILLRRLETKTLQLSVFCLHNQNKRKEAAAAEAAMNSVPKKKGWFFGRGETKSSEEDVGSEGDESKDIFLGKVIIEFKQLLTQNCLAGDFPILVNSKAIGGVLRVCLRTRPILNPDRYEGISWEPSDGAPPSISISTYKQGLSFTFPHETNSEESTSAKSAN